MGYQETSHQTIKIKLRSYDPSLLERSVDKIIKAVSPTGAVINGPIPLPTKKWIDTVLKSTHVHKKARNQYQIETHVRLLLINNSSSSTVDALMNLELAHGVEPEIKA